MRRILLVLSMTTFLALAACADGGSETSLITGPEAASKPSKVADPTPTWTIPSSAGLTLAGDGAAYANSGCGVSTRLYSTTAGSGSGDATLQLASPAGGRNCPRYLTFSNPDGTTESTSRIFVNLNQLHQESGYQIPIGGTDTRRLIINPGSGACGRIIFGNNHNNVGEGSTRVTVTRTTATSWTISTPAGALAWCESLAAAGHPDSLFAGSLNFSIAY